MMSGRWQRKHCSNAEKKADKTPALALIPKGDTGEKDRLRLFIMLLRRRRERDRAENRNGLS
jgi:hypothetical protein